VELTTYVECAYWLNAKVGQYLKKGLLVQLYGRMNSRAWVSKDGEAKSSLTCNIAYLKFLSGSVNSTSAKQGESEGNSPDDDDLPF
jgi:single-strand DNA-binding protein